MSLFSVVENSHRGIYVPEYIAWDFVFSDTVIGSIRSKNKRKIVRKTADLLQSNGIIERTERIESKKKFLFLLDFFKRAQSEKGNEYVLNEEWFDRNTKRQRTLESLELWKGDTLIGMKIYSYDTEGFFLSHKATKKEFDKLIDVGLLLDFLSFERAHQLGYSVVKTGKGKNLFGILVQFSLYEYKISLGLHIRISRGSPMQKLYFSEKTSEEQFIIYCLIDSVEKLFFVHPESMNIDKKIIEKLQPVNMQLTPIVYTDFLALQK